jgi:hypothetical protein
MKSTPTKIGRVSPKKGDCGYQLEQLLSNNMRFSFQHYKYSSTRIDELTLVSTSGRYGYYVPDNLIVAVAASPARFYTSNITRYFQHASIQVCHKVYNPRNSGKAHQILRNNATKSLHGIPFCC